VHSNGLTDNRQEGRLAEIGKALQYSSTKGGTLPSEKLDVFAQDFAEQIDGAGQIHMRDGLSWWQRTVSLSGACAIT
jgi:hypothetical protein